MRVLHLCKSFSKRSETFIYDQLREQKRQGLDVRVLTHRRALPQERPFEPVTVVPRPSDWNLKRIGYRLQEVLGLHPSYTSYWRTLRPRLEEEIRRVEPDVIHAHFGPVGAMIAPIADEMGVPTVVSFYGYDISELSQTERWTRLYDRIWQCSSAVTVLSREMKERALEAGSPPESTHIVHLGRRLDQFPYRPPNPPISHFLTVGRLAEKKGHFDAIQVVERAIQQSLDLHLTIVGDGPLRDPLHQYVRVRGLDEHVALLGSLPNEKVAELMSEADAFLLCSKTAENGDTEGTPTVLIEAQAVGLPCVSTRHAGIPEMLPEANHRFLAPEGNVDVLFDCVRRLVDLDQSELETVAEAGRQKIEEEFQLEGEMKKLDRIYEQQIP
jgi:colanic acid/amylovoran biosynthesis glycosyltransferase